MRHAPDVAARQLPAIGIDRQAAAVVTDGAAAHEGAALALAAKAVVFQLHDHLRAEVVVDLRHVDVLRPYTRSRIEAFCHCRMSGRGKTLIGHVHPVDGAAPVARAAVATRQHPHRLAAQVARAFSGCHDDGDRAVILQAEVVQTMRVGQQGRSEVVFTRQWLAQRRVRVGYRVGAGRDRHFGKVLARGAVQKHVAPRQQGKHLPRPDQAGR